MVELRSVDVSGIHAAFADYAMGSSEGLPEERLLLRMRKNAVDYEASVGAYEEGRMVGFTLVGLDAWGGRSTAYDAGTGIVPTTRGRGLAHRMFDHALPALAERGVEEFVLEVLQDNAPAIRAYRKARFETTRTLRSFVAARSVIRRPASSRWTLRTIDLMQFERVAEEMDWLPSFENRISAVRAILSDVSLVGAFEKERCVGAYAYSAPLRWLLSLVCRSHRRLGIGRALLVHVVEHLPDGVERIAALNVNGADDGMQGFLGHLGFTPLVDQFEMRRAVA
ncbi:MAG: GNAT family N-acetyltransferase [Candidatus Bipolaricaulis sp.]|nr:GNAT family N-acetyltransferase [Candidatus Bipolaricaulis sp.]